MTENSAALALVSLVKTKPKASNRGPTPKKVLAGVEKTQGILKDPTLWSSISPEYFVYAYALLHQMVYGIGIENELSGKEFLGARSAAKRILDKEFSNDAEAMTKFLRWVWTREKGREDWRRQNENGGSRITWRKQFSSALVTEYRLYLARTFTRVNNGSKKAG